MATKPLILETAFATYTASMPALGEGGSGRVYAVTSDDGSELAAKILDGAKATKKKLKRFKNEYLFGYRNEHPNVLTILDYGVLKSGDTSSPFLRNAALRLIFAQPDGGGLG
jgi:serine/threonine protein kinase